MDIIIKVAVVIIAIYIVVDIYFRIKVHTRFISFLMLSNDVINKALVNKGLLKREDVDRARGEVVENLKIVNPKNYKEYKKTISEMGINIEK